MGDDGSQHRIHNAPGSILDLSDVVVLVSIIDTGQLSIFQQYESSAKLLVRGVHTTVGLRSLADKEVTVPVTGNFLVVVSRHSTQLLMRIIGRRAMLPYSKTCEHSVENQTSAIPPSPRPR